MPTSAALLQLAALRTPLARWLWPPYRYMFTPPQLAFLGRELEAAPGGSALEIGCANGATTVWLNQWLAAAGVDRAYVAIDTFAAFLSRDIAVEAERGRDPRRISKSFRGPTRQRFDTPCPSTGSGTSRWSPPTPPRSTTRGSPRSRSRSSTSTSIDPFAPPSRAS